MTILLSDSFASLASASTLTGRTLDNALGGTGTVAWTSTGTGFQGFTGGGRVGYTSSSSLNSVDLSGHATAKKIRIRFNRDGGTGNNVLLIAKGLNSNIANNCVGVLLADGYTSLRVCSFTSGARTDHATTGITMPAADWWVELEVDGLVVTARILNPDTSVRNTATHTFGTLPSSGDHWGVIGYFGDVVGIYDDFIVEDLVAADTTAPILTSATATAVTSNTATVGATTDKANGTLRVVVTTSATQPTITQIKAGQNHLGAAAPYAGSQTITTIGAKTFSATGLTASTTYYAHNLHTDAASNDSNRLTSASFTTLATPKLASTTLTTDGTTAAASLTGLRWAWWDAAPPNLATAPIISGTTGTTNGSGVFTVTLTGTTLNVGQTGTLLVLTSDGTAGSTANRAYSAPVVVS